MNFEEWWLKQSKEEDSIPDEYELDEADIDMVEPCRKAFLAGQKEAIDGIQQLLSVLRR